MASKLIALLVVLFIYNTSSAQVDTVRDEYKGFEFVTVNSSPDGFGISVLNVYKDGKVVYNLDEDLRIESIAFVDLKGNGEKSALIQQYTGGAHCCFIMYVGDFSNDRFTIVDSIFWGDSYYYAEDLNSDGKTELVGGYVGFAYEFTSFAGSVFPMLIYGYKDGRVQMVNADFKKEVYAEIEEFKKEMMQSYPDYNCPEAEDEYWGSEAGEVQSFLAAIVFDYASINEADKGYELVDEFYKCANKEKFKNYLRDTHNLK